MIINNRTLRALFIAAAPCLVAVWLWLLGCAWADKGKPSGAGEGTGNGGGVARELPRELIGHWVTEVSIKWFLGNMSLILSNDGTGVIGDNSVTWKVENKRLVLSANFWEIAYNYNVSNSLLTLSVDDGAATLYVKKEFLDAITGGIAYEENKNYNKAIEEFTKAVQVDSNSAPAYRFRGLAYLKKEDYSAAIEDFVRALKIDPDDAEAEDGLERAGELRGDAAVPAIPSTLPDEKDGQICRDDRDGQIYRTVKIGNQTWTAKNLNYKTDSSWCYQDNSVNCKRYGRLYDWNTAITACPAGWHLPSRFEWDSLATAVGGERTFTKDGDIFWVGTGKKLKAKRGWESYEVSGNGDDSYGFSALPGAERGVYDGDVSFTGYEGYWWTATEYNRRNAAYSINMRYDTDFVSEDHKSKHVGLSVRCVQNTAPPDKGDLP
jgi:uncharacterized protein (TIGR02145 family)